MRELQEAGFGAEELRKAGTNVAQLRAAGASVADMRAGAGGECARGGLRELHGDPVPDARVPRRAGVNSR